jgi:hypothetical protein
MSQDLRLFDNRYLVNNGRAPSVAQIPTALKLSPAKTKSALSRLAETHAIVLQENGEIWRAAPFSAVPTPFSVKIAKHTYYGNCIWDALGIPAMLAKAATVAASCACCNFDMPLHVTDGKLLEKSGTVHFAVPARHWYDDIVFT